VVAKYVVLAPVLDERARRLWAAAESRAIGFGGDALVSAATGLARQTIRRGRQELAAGPAVPGRIRQPGAGRPALEETQPGLTTALEALVEPLTRGDPESPLRWTCKSRANLTAELVKQGWAVSSTTVGRLLHQLGYRLQSVRKSREGASHPDRNAQFELINATATAFLDRQQPVISVDTKKKELVGDFTNAGREWQPSGAPETTLVHDFPGDAIGKAIPYGVYDMARNEAWVSVGRDHDTPAFAVASIRQWWKVMGRRAYPKADRLFITADAGGSNGYRARAWKIELQKLADDPGVFVRSLASRGSLGGISNCTDEVADLLDAFGKDVVIVETVGVGQDEVEVAELAHSVVVVSIPGMGDDVQAIKAGVLEIADVFAVNKADREGADRTVKDLQLMLELRRTTATRGGLEHDTLHRMTRTGAEDPHDPGWWEPPIVKTVATRNEGVAELAAAVDRHRAHLEASGERGRREVARARAAFLTLLRERLMQGALARLAEEEGHLDEVAARIAAREADPYELADEMAARL